jgi:hypothetical protein
MVQVQTHNDKNIRVGGTGLQGYLNNLEGQQLVEKFGEPLLGHPTDKVEFEWNLLVEGMPITIYSWKNYGEKSFEQIRTWNVGGKNSEALRLLDKLGLKTSTSHNFW